ncbi:hypothetical protein L6164_003342 [Bauhinia variegata]|uniref:Uncharacterized protein n=1 Tax=Bauhinia variegata TaxID=167791 RepID=A0ACB9Q156_BAUVA|nr:hypothetical protein L6164_003342 [Bauhinia variegata]
MDINGNLTVFVATRSNNGIQKTNTPLDKFSSRSSTLKDCLVQEYIDFLNKASREELLELKVLADSHNNEKMNSFSISYRFSKTAEYIIELREESPLKSQFGILQLNDLKKIGLSSRQVQNLFIKAARTLFENKAEDSMAD